MFLHLELNAEHFNFVSFNARLIGSSWELIENVLNSEYNAVQYCNHPMTRDMYRVNCKKVSNHKPSSVDDVTGKSGIT